ncbi:MAG: hypothetical protein IPJ43_14880 [Saprospiraceae bacterium]|nr:hypothetical protein [Saprospiraceae bacterium]
MNKYILAFSIFTFIFIACDKDLNLNTNVSTYNYDKIDPDGGSWITVFINKSDISCNAPVATSSPEYSAQLTDLKSKSISISQSQQDAINRWGQML